MSYPLVVSHELKYRTICQVGTCADRSDSVGTDVKAACCALEPVFKTPGSTAPTYLMGIITLMFRYTDTC